MCEAQNTHIAPELKSACKRSQIYNDILNAINLIWFSYFPIIFVLFAMKWNEMSAEPICETLICKYVDVRASYDTYAVAIICWIFHLVACRSSNRSLSRRVQQKVHRYINHALFHSSFFILRIIFTNAIFCFWCDYIQIGSKKMQILY